MSEAPGLSIRGATEADVALVAALIRELAEYERLLHEVTMTEDGLRTALFGSRPCAEVAIAEGGDGEPLGFALFFHNFSTFLGLPGIYLEDLFVRPAHRSRGVGRALLEHLAGLARERGCGRLEWSVLDWNQPAIGFYRRLGAVPQDEWTTYRLTGPALERLADGTEPQREG
ncbi:MAG TPA: GNAT family N-acetyltransferase [Candidatus Dormibacteraeota bacterium]|nr:GNAT family N-acetyltransferase [Candidatus Dormibacteraeota bacterium]